jgi:hypothetical protein
MLRCLTGTGIDIVTAANNHGGDYGPSSVADTVMWCEKAGLVCAGIGERPAVAQEPRLVRVGPVRVAIAGMDSTMPYFRVEEGRPGTDYASEKDLEGFTERMGALGRWADGRCDLLVLTIHWGNNWVRGTQAAHREMARIAFANGVDLILGHSAHRLQGIEVVDGKAVIYDMGNLLFDCELKPEGQQCALFRVHLSREGVHRIEVLPTQALNGHTILARHDKAQEILSEMGDLCAALGTDLGVDEDVEGRPMGVIDIPKPKVTARREPESDLAFAVFPAEGEDISPMVCEAVLVAEVPEGSRAVVPPAEPAPGIELLASRLPDTVTEGGILHVSTWWRVSEAVSRNVMVALQLSVDGQTPRRGAPWYTRHDPGDWTMPLSLLEPEQIVEDRYPARLAGLPAGPCKVYAVVMDTTQLEGSRICGRPYLLGEVEILPGRKN